MGTWAAPTTIDRVETLIVRMSSPIRADQAVDVLYDIMGDDSLFDMIALAREVRVDADVRGLVTLRLDEWLNWTPASDMKFEAGEASGLLRQALEHGCTLIGEDDVLYALLKQTGPDAARASVAHVLDLDEEGAKTLETFDGLVEGTDAVQAPDGRIFRVEGIWGIVTEAPDACRGLVEDNIRRQSRSFRA